MTGWTGALENQKKGGDASRTHGMHGTRTYRSWASMIQRCTNKNNQRWASYGGAGIKVCERWNSFENFLADMGERPEGKTLDRYPDRHGNYEPENCRWATATEQQNNMRSNHIIVHDGRSATITEWANLLDIGVTTLITRLSRGWPLERVLEKSTSDTRQSNNSSGFPGVSEASPGRWIAQLSVNGKRITAKGSASTPREAYKKRVECAREHGVELPEGDAFDI